MAENGAVCVGGTEVLMMEKSESLNERAEGVIGFKRPSEGLSPH